MKKLFDLRFVIGVFFLLIGIILLLWYMAGSAGRASVNLWCGIAFTLFGAVMTGLSFSGRGESGNDSAAI